MSGILLASSLRPAEAAEPAAPALHLVLRDRVPSTADPEPFTLRERSQRWDPKKTAIIICDMWDLHGCKRAALRVREMAPRMNRLIARAREQGVFIIHAPSACMDAYQDTPMRRRAQEAPKAHNLPPDIGSGCKRLPSEEKAKYPLDETRSFDDDPTEHAEWVAHLTALGRNPRAPWKRQIDVLQMDERDAVSDSGVEIWNLLEQRGLDHVILMGVHTNMCVLGRPFGLRQMAKNGKQVVLMRDLTDSLYNPASWPYVSHFRGTDLIVEHIEKYVCPTVTSDQILGGQPFRFRADVRPVVVLLAVAENEYRTAQTLPVFARDVLQDRLGLDTVVLRADPKVPHMLPGLAEALGRADLLLLSARRQALPARDLEAVRQHLAKGKPLVGIRTASHAFDARGKGPPGHAEWPKFDPEVLGGNYRGYCGGGSKPTVTLAPAAKQHPILTGVETPFAGHGSLYQGRPLVASATPLLLGSIPGRDPEPVAWVNHYGAARVFYTSLGHVDDFQDERFLRLLGNAVLWGLSQPLPASAEPQNRR
jgi:nicotinamidase-related amidase/type 1 glutamine amidotransferase